MAKRPYANELLSHTERIWEFPSLKGVGLIGVQHLMDSTLDIMRLFIHRGLDPKNTFLIGKTYSTSTEVYNDLLEEKINVHKGSFSFDSHQSYDRHFEKILSQFVKQSIKKLIASGVKKIIVLDDGGHLAKIIKESGFMSKDTLFVGVEQTSSGYHLIKEAGIPFPIINIARCDAKLKYETSHIVKSLYERILHFDPTIYSKNKKILILGKGHIGLTLSKYFKNQSNITFYDPKYNTPKELPLLLQHADLIIGCSGKTSLKKAHYKYIKKGATLASTSSSDREFDAHHLRRAFPKSKTPHQDFHGPDFTLLQSGFPVNFWDTRFNISLKHMQITMGLLASGVFQALTHTSKAPKFIRHNRQKEEFIVKMFKAIRAKSKLEAA